MRSSSCGILGPFLISASAWRRFNIRKDIVQQVGVSLNDICACSQKIRIAWIRSRLCLLECFSARLEKVVCFISKTSNRSHHVGDIPERAASYSRLICYTIRLLGCSMNWHAPSLPLVDIKALSGRAYELRSPFSRLSCQLGLCANQRAVPWDIWHVICPGIRLIRYQNMERL